MTAPARRAAASTGTLDVSMPPPRTGLDLLGARLADAGLALTLVLGLPIGLMALLGLMAAGVWVVLAIAARVF